MRATSLEELEAEAHTNEIAYEKLITATQDAISKPARSLEELGQLAKLAAYWAYGPNYEDVLAEWAEETGRCGLDDRANAALIREVLRFTNTSTSV